MPGLKINISNDFTLFKSFNNSNKREFNTSLEEMFHFSNTKMKARNAIQRQCIGVGPGEGLLMCHHPLSSQ